MLREKTTATRPSKQLKQGPWGPFEELEAKKLGELADVLRMPVEEAEQLVFQFLAWMEVDLKKRFGRKWLWARAWQEPKSKWGNPTPLHRIHIYQHLLGKYSVGVRRDGRVGLLVIDYDTKTPERRRDLCDRIEKVQAVLGVPALRMRSSDSGGVYDIHFLSDLYEPKALSLGVAQVLVEAGIEVTKGKVEIFPDGSHLLRLPYGPGSYLLDPNDLSSARIRKGKPDPAKSDLRTCLETLIEAAANKRRPLEDLIGAEAAARIEQGNPQRQISKAQKKKTKKTKSRNTTAKIKRPHLRGAEYWRAIDKCLRGVTAYDQRNEEAKLLLRYWVIVQRLSKEQTLERFEHWLLHGNHTSKDLEADREGTIKRMLREAPKLVASCMEYRAKHPWRGRRASGGPRRSQNSTFPFSSDSSPKGPYPHQQSTAKHLWRVPGGSNGGRSVSLTPLGEVRRAAEKAQRKWRDLVSDFVTERDRTTLQDLEVLNPKLKKWLVPRLRVFLGLLRRYQARAPGQTLVALHWKTLLAITGGRKAPGGTVATYQGRRVPCAYSYRLMVQWAVKLGWLDLELEQGAVRGVSARVYRLTLPGRATP